MLLGTPFGKSSHLLDVQGSELDLLSKKVKLSSSEAERWRLKGDRSLK